MGKGWNIHGSVVLPEIRDIVREELVEDELLASKLLPEVLVDAPMARIRTIAAGQDKKLIDASRASNGTYSRVKWSMSSDQYETDVKGIEVSWDNNDALANESINVDEQAEAGFIAANTLKISREARVSQALFNPTNFTGADFSITEAARWDTLTIDALNDRITFGQKKLYKRYGLQKKHLTLIIHPDVIDKLVGKIAIEEGIKETISVKLMTSSEQGEVLRKRLGLKEVIATTAPYNDMPFTEEEQDGANFTDIYPSDRALLCVLADGKKGFKGAGIGWQPVYRKATTDFEVEQYAEPGKDGQVIRAKEWRGIKIRKEWGFLFSNVFTTN